MPGHDPALEGGVQLGHVLPVLPQLPVHDASPLRLVVVVQPILAWAR